MSRTLTTLKLISSKPMKTAHDLVLAAKAQCSEVSVKDAHTAILSADVIIDVREADEYAAGHLAGAINIPRGLLEFKLSGTPALEKRDLSVVLYCKTSGRAALAANSMPAACSTIRRAALISITESASMA